MTSQSVQCICAGAVSIRGAVGDSIPQYPEAGVGHPKDSVPVAYRKGVICSIACAECPHTYIAIYVLTELADVLARAKSNAIFIHDSILQKFLKY